MRHQHEKLSNTGIILRVTQLCYSNCTGNFIKVLTQTEEEVQDAICQVVLKEENEV